MIVLRLLAFLALSFGAVHAQRINLIWPTPGTEFFDGRPPETFVQPTASGIPDSGQFGCRRSGGAQFHEGLDIRPTKRNRQGEPLDDIVAVLPGVVRHISRSPGNSSYGRYVVLEHPSATPAIYTLYAHLSAVPSSLRVGAEVGQGEVLGTMGRSASTSAIPKDRAHLHFEMGLWMTRRFQGWYDGRKFGSRNDHGIFNGMNLMGFDPLEFYQLWKERRINTVDDYFAQMKPAVTVRVSTRRIPDFIERYPSLLSRPMDTIVAGWEISFNETGLPFRFTPLGATEVAGIPLHSAKVTQVDVATAKRYRCRHLVYQKGGQWLVARDLATVLELLLELK